MNPDTKLTVEQLRTICARHGIPYILHNRINSGFSHEVHRLNNDLVIKLFNYPKKSEKFTTELAMLSSSLPFLKPKLIASYKAVSDLERSYIIMSYVDGISLGSVWHKANNIQRESLIKGIASNLRMINQVDISALKLEKSEPWHISLPKGGNKLAKRLLKKSIIDIKMAKKIKTTLERSAKFLITNKLYPVYWDIHFDNFIVNEDFELQAIIDLENVELTSLDYPLFVVQKLTDQPHKYLREEDEKYAKIEDYSKIIEWYKKHYPEMFGFKHLKRRIKTYQLLDELGLLENWSHVKGAYERLNSLLS